MRTEKLSAISGYSPEESCMLSAALCNVSDSFVRVSERISALRGLDAPKPVAPPANVVNNTAAFMNGTIERIKQRRLS